jgi:hypothetical protein
MDVIVEGLFGNVYCSILQFVLKFCQSCCIHFCFGGEFFLFLPRPTSLSNFNCGVKW